MHTFAKKPKATQQITSAKSTIPGRAHFGQSHEVSSMRHLQPTIGNQAVLRLLQTHAEEPKPGMIGTVSSGFGHDFSRIPIHSLAPRAIRTKLAINQPGDVYEQEVDRISEQAMRMSEPQLQRACACGGRCSKCQTEQTGWEHESLQTKRVQASDTGQIAAPPIVHEVLSSSGQPLDPATRGFMESRFGHDFSRVHVHTDAKASESADVLEASAYTVGHHVVFSEGEYAQRKIEGCIRLAHELAHVVQQDFRVPPILRIGGAGEAAETEAEHAATTAIYGGHMRLLHGGHSGVIQRDRRKPQSGKSTSREKIVDVKQVTTRQALTDVIKDLSGSMSEKDWQDKKKAAIKAPGGDTAEARKIYLELYTEIAMLAQADKLANILGPQAQGINFAKSEKDLEPGLNFSFSFADANGRTSYVDKGINYGAKLPVTLSGLPSIAILLGPNAFSLDKAAALTTLRHEMMHAEHMGLSINWLKKWQDQNKGKVKANEAESKFKLWLSSQKSIPPLEFELSMESAEGRSAKLSELLGYSEGFMTSFHLERVPKDDEISKAEASSYALLELKTAGKYWANAKNLVQGEALGRIQQYYCAVLDQPRRDVFDKWVASKLELASSTEKMSDSAKATHAALVPIVPFLKNLKSIKKETCGKSTPKRP